MEIYLDESGDMGFNFETKKPSRHFVITLLVCNDVSATKRIERAVRKTLKHKLNHAKKTLHHELKGSQVSSDIKHYFYRQILKGEGWLLCAVTLDKARLNTSNANYSKHRLYNMMAREAMKLVNLKNQSRVRLIVDRSKGLKEIKVFNQLIINYIESQLPLSVPFSIDHERSHQNLLLQAVDLFCWGIFRHYEVQDSTWYATFSDKVQEHKMEVV